MQERSSLSRQLAAGHPWALGWAVASVAITVAAWQAPLLAAAPAIGDHVVGTEQTPPSPPAPPAPPVPPASNDAVVGHTGEGPGSWWAYIKPDSVTGRGSTDDARINALRAGGPVFWFVRDKREYVVRDAATLKEVEQIVAPLDALSKKQAQGAAANSAKAEADQVTAQIERKISDLIAKTLADGRATPLKTQ